METAMNTMTIALSGDYQTWATAWGHVTSLNDALLLGMPLQGKLEIFPLRTGGFFLRLGCKITKQEWTDFWHEDLPFADHCTNTYLGPYCGAGPVLAKYVDNLAASTRLSNNKAHWVIHEWITNGGGFRIEGRPFRLRRPEGQKPYIA